MPVESISVTIRGELVTEEGGLQRVARARREMRVGGNLSDQQASDLLTAAQNCVLDNTLSRITEFDDQFELQGEDPARRDYLPPAGPRHTPELVASARALDELLLVPVRVGGHMILVDEAFGRERLGCWSVGLLMGAAAADAVAALRQEAAAHRLPLTGVDVEAEADTERRYGQGPNFPSSQVETEPFWGWVKRAKRSIRLWGALDNSHLPELRAAVLTTPLARTLAVPVEVENDFRVVAAP